MQGWWWWGWFLVLGICLDIWEASVLESAKLSVVCHKVGTSSWKKIKKEKLAVLCYAVLFPPILFVNLIWWRFLSRLVRNLQPERSVALSQETTTNMVPLRGAVTMPTLSSQSSCLIEVKVSVCLLSSVCGVSPRVWSCLWESNAVWWLFFFLNYFQQVRQGKLSISMCC